MRDVKSGCKLALSGVYAVCGALDREGMCTKAVGPSRSPNRVQRRSRAMGRGPPTYTAQPEPRPVPSPSRVYAACMPRVCRVWGAGAEGHVHRSRRPVALALPSSGQSGAQTFAPVWSDGTQRCREWPARARTVCTRRTPTRRSKLQHALGRHGAPARNCAVPSYAGVTVHASVFNSRLVSPS